MKERGVVYMKNLNWKVIKILDKFHENNMFLGTLLTNTAEVG